MSAAFEKMPKGLQLLDLENSYPAVSSAFRDQLAQPSSPSVHSVVDHAKFMTLFLGRIIVDNDDDIDLELKRIGAKHSFLYDECGVGVAELERLGELLSEVILKLDGIRQSKEATKVWRLLISTVIDHFRDGFETELRFQRRRVSTFLPGAEHRMLAERLRFFEQLIAEERAAVARSLARIPPRGTPRRLRLVRPPPAPATPGPRRMPVLPERVLWHLFALLDYRQQSRLERVCRSWKKVIRQKQRRDIRELVVELNGQQVDVLQQVGFQRLSLTCPVHALHALSGVVRRCSQHLEKLTCDLQLLGLINTVRELRDWFKYFQFCKRQSEASNIFTEVESVWLVVTKCSAEIMNNFLKIETHLFTKLAEIVIQVNVSEDSILYLDDLLKVFMNRHSSIRVNLELHASSCMKILCQLQSIQDKTLNNLKLICTAMDNAPLSLAMVSMTLSDHRIHCKSICFREWYLSFDGKIPISRRPLSCLRFSSCTVRRCDDMVNAIHVTWSQKKAKKRADDSSAVTTMKSTTVIPSTKSTRLTGRGNGKRVKKLPFIKRVEMAGYCTVVDLDFLKRSAHEELERRIREKCPTISVDTSDIYYLN